MIEWNQPIVTTCGRPARLIGQNNNGSIAVAIQIIANNGGLYEICLCSNAAGRVHGGMYRIVNDLAMLGTASVVPAIDVAKATQPQPPDFELLYSGDELPPLRDVVRAVMRYTRVARRAPFLGGMSLITELALVLDEIDRINPMLAQLGETRIRYNGFRIQRA